MTDTLLVRPRRGLILAGIPRQGAQVPTADAERMIADQLVEPVPAPVVETKPPSPTKGPSKQGRTRGDQ